jgi:hypothetical protein
MKNLERYRRALLNIYEMLGPDAGNCRTNKCDGCKHEMGEAAEVARRALQLPKAKAKSIGK